MAAHLKPVVQAFLAEADLRSLQYTQVKVGSTNDYVTGAGSDEEAMGVLLNAPNTGEVAEVAIGGGAKVKVASNVTNGASCGVGALGVGKDAAAAKKCLGKFQDSGVSGDIVPILIDRHVTPA